MLDILQVLQGIIERGLIFGLVVAAVYIASTYIKFDNLAVEGAFGLGGALAALCAQWHINPWGGLCAATIAGCVSGIITALLYTRLKINNLISGIIVTTGLFSIILKIAGSNASLYGKPTLSHYVPTLFAPFQSLMVLLLICGVLLTALSWLLTTEVGFLLRAVGHSPQMLTNIGKSVDRYTLLGLALSNGLAALSGALFVYYTGYFSIFAGVGVLIIGLIGMLLASMISTSFGGALVIGSILYQTIIALTFELQINPDWNKLITALLMVLLLASKQWIAKKECHVRS